MKPRHIRQGLYGLLILFIVNACSPAPGGTDADIAAINELITERFKAAWDAGEADVIAAYFTENADLALPVSGWIKGREAIRATFDWDKPAEMKGQFNPMDIRFLSADIALVNVEAHFSGGTDPEGQAIPDYWDSATAILQKKDGKWEYVALRVMPARASLEDVRSAVENAWSAYISSVESGDLDGCMAVFAPDFELFGPDQAPQRMDQMRQHYQELLSTTTVDVTGNEILEFDLMGNRAIHRGIYDETFTTKEGESTPVTMNYYAIWERQPDDSWKMKRLIFNYRA